MVAVSSFIPVLKYGFLTLVVSCAGYLIASITVFKHINSESIADLLVRHQISMQAEGAAGVLDKGFERCLTHPSNVFCLMTAHKHFDQNDTKKIIEMLTTQKHEAEKTKVHPVFEVLSSLTVLSRKLAIQPVLLDPSLLFCLLNPTSKTLLLKHGFNPTHFLGPKNSVIMGIEEVDAQILTENIDQVDGFTALKRHSHVQKYFPNQEVENITHQFTFERPPATVYADVFYRRNGYLSLFRMEEVSDSRIKTHEIAFENFTAVRIPNNLDLELYVPSDPVHFLYQMQASNLVQCPSNDSLVVQSHPTLTREQLENRAAVALQELKTVFHPYLVRFWLWGESLSGLYRSCNIFETTTDLNIAALNTDLEKLNLTEIFFGNEFLTLTSEFTVVDNEVSKISFDCHGLIINMFVANEDGESLRFYEDFDGNMQWLTYYKSQLESTDVFGQIVYFPIDYRASTNHKKSPLK